MRLCDPADDLGERFNRDRHPPGIGMQEIEAIRHKPDMPREEDQITALQRFIRIERATQRAALLVTVAGTVQASQVERKLDEPGTVNAACAATAP